MSANCKSSCSARRPNCGCNASRRTGAALRWLVITAKRRDRSDFSCPGIRDCRACVQPHVSLAFCKRPGEILLEEFLRPMEISQYRLAKDIHVPARRISEIVHGKRAISPDTALRLARYFGASERFRLNLQARYDVEVEKDRWGDQLEREALAHTAAQ